MEIGIGFCAPVLLHSADHAAWRDVHGDQRYWHLAEGQRIAVAGEEIRVISTSSPTLGSVSLHIADRRVLFTGDTLTHPSVNENHRIVPVGGNTFAGLPANTTVNPGHGNSYLLGEVLAESAPRLVRENE